MRISDWSSDVCSSDLLPHVDNSVGKLLRTLLARAKLCSHGYAVVHAFESSLLFRCQIERGVQQRPHDQGIAEVGHCVELGRTGRSEERRVGKEWVSTV